MGANSNQGLAIAIFLAAFVALALGMALGGEMLATALGILLLLGSAILLRRDRAVQEGDE